MKKGMRTGAVLVFVLHVIAAQSVSVETNPDPNAQPGMSHALQQLQQMNKVSMQKLGQSLLSGGAPTQMLNSAAAEPAGDVKLAATEATTAKSVKVLTPEEARIEQKVQQGSQADMQRIKQSVLSGGVPTQTFNNAAVQPSGDRKLAASEAATSKSVKVLTKEEAIIEQKVQQDKQAVKDKIIFGQKNPDLKPGQERSCQVLIMGAGMAGLTAFKTLVKEGITDILMLDGAERIGGRVKNVHFGGISVEVGANWVHFKNMKTDEANPVEDMVKKAGLHTIEDKYDDIVFRYKGANVTDKGEEAQKRLDRAIKTMVKMGNRKIKNKEPDVNFKVALALSDWRAMTPVEKAVEYFNFDFEFADEPLDTGLKDNIKTFSGEHEKPELFVADPRGYGHIMNIMAEELGLKEDKNLFLQEYVTEVQYGLPGKHKIKVTAKNNKTKEINTYKAEHAIMTFSLGVYQSGLIKFVPPLPAWKMETIYMFKMTKYEKIFVKFPNSTKAFWDDNHYIIYCDPNSRGSYQMWQNLEAKNKYFPKGTNMLLATSIGRSWDRAETLSKEEIMAELFQILKNMYGDKAVMPEDIFLPDWHTNPLFFGAYSNWPIGISQATYQNLDAPVGTLYMAGEACSPTFSGYLHGAIESGELTATELAKCIKFNECEIIPLGGYGYQNSQCLK